MLLFSLGTVFTQWYCKIVYNLGCFYTVLDENILILSVYRFRANICRYTQYVVYIGLAYFAFVQVTFF